MGRRNLSILGAVAFLVAVGIAAVFVPAKSLLPVYVICISIVTFVVYAVDKAAAMRGSWRISEKTLHILALAGGWPGGLIAQQTLRHKSSKPSFQAVFWVTVVLNCVVMAYFLTPNGSENVMALLKDLLAEIH